jgi:hypothetical protein
MTQVRIVSHNNGASARALATALGNSQLLSRQQPTPLRRFVRDALVVNMGCTELNFAPNMNMPPQCSSPPIRCLRSRQCKAKVYGLFLSEPVLSM